MNNNSSSNYKMLQKIGSGATAEVWKATRGNKQYALKIFNRCNTKESAFYVQNENLYGSKVSHRSVISPNEVFAVMDD